MAEPETTSERDNGAYAVISRNAPLIRRMALVTSYAPSLVRFRGPLIKAIIRRGVKVYALAPDYDSEVRQAVTALGAEPVDYSLCRTGVNPLRDAMDIVRLTHLLGSLKLDAVLTYFIKPVIYGSLAAQLARIPRQFSLITGLGYVFSADSSHDSAKQRWLRRGARFLYQLALRSSERVFVQNVDDQMEVISRKLARPNQISNIVATGVDLEHFAAAPPVLHPIRFLWIGRLLRQKGVVDFVSAARLVRKRYHEAEFVLVGGSDANPGSIGEEQVIAWVREGLIEWPGKVEDVRPWIRRASVFVLPSYYREGKPRSIQEAMAMGRPVITTEVPGCRETVEVGRNGFLVPPRNPKALAEAMCRFIAEPTLIKSMGRESRRMAEELYDVDLINERMLEAMGIPPATDVMISQGDA